MFALLLVSFLPSVMAQPDLFGHDLKDTGSWSEDVDVLKEIDKIANTHLGDNKNLSFRASYINIGRVQNLYFGLEKWQWNTADNVAQGTAPLQLLIQRYHAVGGMDVIAINAFTGLVAYRNNENNTYGRPDKNSELYYGWSLYGELLKSYCNQIGHDDFGVPDYELFDTNVVGTATPIWDNSTENTVKFGMSYENLFIFWQKVNIAVEPNNTAGGAQAVFGQMAAVSVMESLNFSYTLTSEDLGNGRTAVKTTTSYEIGPITNLWVREGGYLNCTELGVPFYNHDYITGPGNVTIAHYNATTTPSASVRLNGTVNTHGFSLGVMNYAVILVLDTSQRDDAWDNGTSTIDENSNVSVQQLNLKVAKNAANAYNIDFASKPTYVWNGSTTPLDAPTYVYPKNQISSVITRTLWEGGVWVVKQLWGSNFFGNYKNSIENVYVGDLVYITCFPTWSGLSCVQDPTFIAFTTLQGSFPWAILIVGLVGVVVVLIIAVRIRHKRHQ